MKRNEKRVKKIDLRLEKEEKGREKDENKKPTRWWLKKEKNGEGVRKSDDYHLAFFWPYLKVQFLNKKSYNHVNLLIKNWL